MVPLYAAQLWPSSETFSPEQPQRGAEKSSKKTKPDGHSSNCTPLQNLSPAPLHVGLPSPPRTSMLPLTLGRQNIVTVAVIIEHGNDAWVGSFKVLGPIRETWCFLRKLLGKKSIIFLPVIQQQVAPSKQLWTSHRCLSDRIFCPRQKTTSKYEIFTDCAIRCHSKP